jgi:uncharacterized protein with ParB-like and HNH nuclease domain
VIGTQPTLAKLVKAVDEGQLALPDFQRDFKWPLDFMVELMRSIARGWPIGTFLLLEQTNRALLPARKLVSAPNPKKVPQLLILDGQQRMTAIYQALRGKGRFTFYVNMKLLRQEGEFTDECWTGF